MEIYKASRQWATRPADERFENLPDLIAQTKAYADNAREAVVQTKSLAVVEVPAKTEGGKSDLALVGPTSTPASFSHYGFGALAQRVGAPAEYLRRLPADLAAANLNHGIASRGGEAGESKLLLHQNGGLIVRAFTSEKYARIWNWEVAERLLPMLEQGWTADPLKSDRASDADLYASDHDMFVFLRNDDRRIREPGSDEGLSRGVFVENSEVGASALKVTRFDYRYQCQNHILWGVQDSIELSVRHIGDMDRKSGEFFATIREFANESVSDDEARIKRAMSFRLGKDKNEVLDLVFGKGIASRKAIGEAYDIAVAEEPALDPASAWGLAQGMTRLSQRTGFADKRTEMDKAAGKILRMSF